MATPPNTAEPRSVDLSCGWAMRSTCHDGLDHWLEVDGTCNGCGLPLMAARYVSGDQTLRLVTITRFVIEEAP